jgi:uncharacterized protein (TIGR02284 family)
MTLQSDAPLAPAALDAIATLHTRSVDTLAGFAKMVEKAEPDFRPIAEDFRALHARHADGLARILAAHGRTPDRDGSFMATVNKAVIAMRAVFDDIDADLMTAIRNGEDHVLTAFDDALAQPLSAAESANISEMRDDLRDLLNRQHTTI